MKVDVKKITGIWDLGFSVDKHTISSTYIGENDWGHPQFDTKRTEIGEAIFQLKYRSDFKQCKAIARAIYENIFPLLPNISFIISMPPSKQREKQPVQEIANELSKISKKQYINGLLVKTKPTPQMKDIDDRDERMAILMNAFSIEKKVANEILPEKGCNILIIDDLYDTGTSLEAATQTLRSCKKINKIFVATATRKR